MKWQTLHDQTLNYSNPVYIVLMLFKKDYKPELEIEINYRLLYKMTHMDLQQKLIG